MLPRTTATDVSTANPRRCTKFSLSMSFERYSCLVLHLIILVIIYFHLDKLTRKQEDLIVTYRSSVERQRNLTKERNDCSHNNPVRPKVNRTTKCVKIYVGSTEIIDRVLCSNMSTNQWLLIQNRQTGSIDFNRSWNEYRRGFGRVSNQSDFWIGNENLHWLTEKYSFRLKIELTNWHNETRRAIYETFRVASKNDHYRLSIDKYHGDMEMYQKIDSFSHWHFKAPFSTYDHYAVGGPNCPQVHGGAGWWYRHGSECAYVQLNGQLSTQIDGFVPFNTGILWIGWRDERNYSFKRVNMAIQRKLKTKTS